MDIQQRCGNYLLHERLNEGGNAEIFVATNRKHKQVIVRRLLPKFKWDFFKRSEFVRGLQIQSQMKHPCIVQILELVRFSKVPFAAMEYIEGMDLRRAMIRRNGELGDPFPLICQMVEGLLYVHQQGYLHLDYKPENVMLNPQDKIKLLDFDLSERIHHIPRRQSNVKGTPSYLAPEQIRREPVDERTDIFALGLTAYELLTRKKPFKAQEQQEIFKEVCDVQSAFAPPRSINPSVPPLLDRIVCRCLEKSPERRYPSVSLILRDLQKSRVLSPA